VPRGASKGDRVTGGDRDVAYFRGKETWLEHEDSGIANVTDYNFEYPRPFVSRDCTATLRRERGKKTMKVQARVTNVIITPDPKKPELGLEKQSDH
jgi:hypothetical protein